MIMDAMILVQFATDELFHEMGFWPEIEPYLLAIAADVDGEAEIRLWALTGLVFNDLRTGQFEPGTSEEQASQLQSLIRISYSVFCLQTQTTRTSRRPLTKLN